MSSEQPVNIKQRIIGAIVLVSLAVIFLPMILKDHNQYSGPVEIADIPPLPQKLQSVQERVAQPRIKPVAPKQPQLPKPKAIPVDKKNQTVVKAATKKPQVKKKIAITPDKTKQDSKKNPPKAAPSKTIKQSYAIQLGSFGSQKNAVELKRKLQKSKYKAYIEVIKTSKGIHHRVRVGPYLKYNQIVAIQKKINRNFKINGKIVSYR